MRPSTSSSSFSFHHGGHGTHSTGAQASASTSPLTLDRYCDMEVRIVPKAGAPFTGVVHAYNHHRRMLWLRTKGANQEENVVMIKIKFIANVEIIRESPFGFVGNSKGTTIEQHFAKFSVQPKAMIPSDIGAIYKSKSSVHREQELEFKRRALAGKLNGLGGFILYRLSQQRSTDSISVNEQRNIVLKDCSVMIKRPYLPTNCVLIDSSAKDSEQKEQLALITKIVENAGDDYDQFNKGG